MYSFKNWNYQRAKAVISWSALMENHCPIMFLYDTIKHYMFCRIPQRVKDPQNLKGKNMKTALKRKISSVLMVTGGLLLSPISDFPVPGNYFTGHYGFLSNADAAGANGIVGSNIFSEIAKKENPAVVNISTSSKAEKKPQMGRRMPPPFGGDPNNPFQDFFERFFDPNLDVPKRSLGSGFIIDEEGYIFTNNHVVKDADEIKVTLMDQKEYTAKVVGTDSKTDIALIKIAGDKKFHSIKLGDSDKSEVGEWVMAIGNPFGLSHTVTVGVISATGRNLGAGPYDHYFQTDASINPGNSGGPLINTQGEVIGINTAIMAGNTGGNIGIGFAIPINMAKQILTDLKTKGSVTRGWLGVLIQKITPEMASSFGLQSTEGALVGDVVKDSPAEKAGIQRGDVIVEFNGQKVSSMEELPTIVAATKPGEEAKVVAIRGGKRQNFQVKIEKLQDTGEKAEVLSQRLGMNVQEITPELADSLKLESTEGILVADVEFGSPSAEAGIRRGDVILEINRNKIKNLSGYEEAVKNSKKGDNLLFLIKRGSGTVFIAVTVAE